MLFLRNFSFILVFICLSALHSHAELLFDPVNPETIDPGASITITLIGDSPPLAWAVSGRGANWASSSTQGTTNTLYVSAEACGTIELYAKNQAGEVAQGSVRVNGGGGTWVNVVSTSCGKLLNLPPYIYLGCTKCSEVIVGGYKFLDCWFGGSRYTERYDGPYCSKWPATEDLVGQTCKDPGSPVRWTVAGLLYHKKWRYQCPGDGPPELPSWGDDINPPLNNGPPDECPSN